jgi:hypothetical protein
MAVKIKANFYECEHDGDLDNYIGDIVSSGGKIISSSVDSDEETGTVVFEVEDKPTFVEKFKQTNAWQFLD